MSAIRTLAVAAADNGRLAPELAAGVARGKSAKSIRRQGRAIIAPCRSGCGLRRSEVAALTDGRCSGGFALEATVAAPRADAPKPSV